VLFAFAKFQLLSVRGELLVLIAQVICKAAVDDRLDLPMHCVSNSTRSSCNPGRVVAPYPVLELSKVLNSVERSLAHWAAMARATHSQRLF
jgi:inner membrane protein involved in colicin E2 resistance